MNGEWTLKTVGRGSWIVGRASGAPRRKYLGSNTWGQTPWKRQYFQSARQFSVSKSSRGAWRPLNLDAATPTPPKEYLGSDHLGESSGTDPLKKVCGSMG